VLIWATKKLLPLLNVRSSRILLSKTFPSRPLRPGFAIAEISPLVESLGDAKLRILVDGCPSLCSLSLSHLHNITEESVSILGNHRPRIPSIAIRNCRRVRLESVLSLLREITIPTIFLNDDDEELQISSVDNLASSIPIYPSLEENVFITDLLTPDSLVQRLVGLLALGNRETKFD
jgi:hypothetical protein